jgi:hypothetical protein
MRNIESVALKNLPSDMNRGRMRPSKGEKAVAGAEPRAKSLKLQSAIEFLTTYVWAILVITLALAALFGAGVLNSGSYGGGSSKCLVSSDFYCLNATLSSTGNLVLIFGQSTSSPLYVTTIACNSVALPGNAFAYAYPGIFLPIGGNFTASVQCYSNGAPFSGKLGAPYSGYLTLTYNSISTGFNQIVIGSLSTAVTH